MPVPTFAAFVDGRPVLVTLADLRDLIGATALADQLAAHRPVSPDALAAVVDTANAVARDTQDGLLAAFDQIGLLQPVAAATELLAQANIDQDAILRQADRDRAKLAAAQIDGLLDQNVQRVTLRNAGMVTDPATGRICPTRNSTR